MTSQPLTPSLPVIRVEPSSGWAPLNLGELWEYRELVFFLIWRDVKVRYKQTVLGVAWAVIQPVLTMALFSVIFGRLAQLPSDGVPYPIFTFAALLPWQLFAGALTAAANSLVGSASLVTKVYFPRLVIPIASVLSTLVDFGISLVVLIALMAWYHVTPTVALFVLPVFILLAIAMALAAGLWFSALHVQYRDVRYVLPFLMQFWLLASPVAYSMSLIPTTLWRTIYALNPMVAVIQGFRWAIVGSAPPTGLVAPSAAMAATLLVSGLFYFRRMEDSFADVI